MLFASVSSAVAGLALLSTQAFALPPPSARLSKRDETTIGFRRVSPAQGQEYNDNDNRLTDDGSSANGQQIGPGVYTAKGPETFIIDDTEPDWYCVLTAEEDAFNEVGKAWIPPSLWYKSEEEIGNHIRELKEDWDPATVFRLASISGQDEDDHQMLIPPALVNDSDLDIHVFCYATREELDEEWHTEDLDYDDDFDNVEGDPED